MICTSFSPYVHDLLVLQSLCLCFACPSVITFMICLSLSPCVHALLVFQSLCSCFASPSMFNGHLRSPKYYVSLITRPIVYTSPLFSPPPPPPSFPFYPLFIYFVTLSRYISLQLLGSLTTLPKSVLGVSFMGLSQSTKFRQAFRSRQIDPQC